MSNSITTYWLIPAARPRRYFASVISSLASQLDATPFEPHVTVYVTTHGGEDPNAVLRDALAGCQPFRLSVADIRCSEEFTKTVFVQFKSSPQLIGLNSALWRASGSEEDYDVNPHLSLVYKTMSRNEKTAIVNSIHVPFPEVLFDCVKVVISPMPIKSREDVEAWRVLATRKLIA